MRIRIDLAYDGTDFKGWATQPSLRTIQGTLEAALATALRVPAITVTCAGRTDTGVHARGQVVHLDTTADVVAEAAGRSQDPPLNALTRRLNGILPPDVRVRRAVEAPEGFDARFSAVWRRYAYRVADGPVDPLTRNHVLAWPSRFGRPLDVEAMNAAAALLLGEHDFLLHSPDDRAGARGPPRSAACWSCAGTAPVTWPSPPCAPTPSATTWSGRWSVACSRWATGAGRPPGPRRCWRRRSGTRR